MRIATTVFANNFRHPAVLAKEAAPLDLLSAGRLELGIGTGYLAPDYALTGIPFDPPGVRVSRLSESVQIIKGLFGDPPVTYAGAYYSITNLEGHPKPLQRPHPPIMIAGGGKRMPSLAAREANIVGLVMQSRGAGLDFMSSATAATTQQIEWVRQAAGDRVAALGFNTLLFGVVVTEQRRQAAEQLAKMRGTTAEQVLDSIHFLVGTVDQIPDRHGGGHARGLFDRLSPARALL